MKKLLLLALLTFGFIQVYAQNSEDRIVLSDKEYEEFQPKFVLLIDDMEAELSHPLGDNAYDLTPDWIEAINVYKDPKKMKDYKFSADTGLILIELKKSAWKKMSKELKGLFVERL